VCFPRAFHLIHIIRRSGFPGRNDS
jgi:hypothetical protein